MTDREIFLEILEFNSNLEEIKLAEFMEYWPETVEKWTKEGYIKDETILEHFGMIKKSGVPINFNCVPAYEEKILEETDEYIIFTDECNCTQKAFKNSSAMPEYIDFPIKERKDFEEMKKRMDPSSAERYPQNWDSLVLEYKNRDYPLGVVIRGPFAFCRDFVKFDELMMMFYDDKELVREMMEFQGDFIIKLFDKVLNDVEVDYIYIGEDMAYKNGTMISPDLIEELVIPVYKKINAFFKEKGVKNRILDSDGNIEAILPMVIESGFNCILPLECAAGMDIVKIREQYPELKLIGGLDKLNIAEGKDKIEYEIKRAVEVFKKGGYIPSFDHSVPPVVSYENYKYYIERLKNELSK